MMTELFIKSPVPGIDGVGRRGWSNKGGRSRQRGDLARESERERHRVVMSPWERY